MPRQVIRMGQSCYITRSIIEGSATLKGDTDVIVPECRFERSGKIAQLQQHAHSSSLPQRICFLKGVKLVLEGHLRQHFAIQFFFP